MGYPILKFTKFNGIVGFELSSCYGYDINIRISLSRFFRISIWFKPMIQENHFNGSQLVELRRVLTLSNHYHYWFTVTIQ